MKNLISRAVNMAVALSLATSSLSALAGVSGGSGNNGTNLAFNPEELKQAGLDFSLDYMKLKGKDVDRRNAMLEKILAKRDKITLGTAAELIERTYHSFVYLDAPECPKNVDDPRDRMTAAVGYYFENQCWFVGSDRSEVPYGNAFRASGQMNMNKVSGSSSLFTNQASEGQGFVLSTVKNWNRGHAFGFTHEASYTSTNLPLVDAPVLMHFLNAMKKSGLGALNAELVFVVGSVGTPDGAQTTYALYPPYSDLAPIPMPVLMISTNASEDDILNFINENAPKVYAFNKLFDQKIVAIPTEGDLIKALEESPDIWAEAQRVNHEITKERVVRALHISYLAVSYGLLAAGAIAAPVALIDVINNALLRPILIKGVIAVISK